MNADNAVNLPEVLAEITALFHAYEAAFMRNDVEALNNYFWNDGALTRYGIADLQRGHAELVAFRAASPAPNFTRTLHNVRITTFGHHSAFAFTEFTRSDTPLKGRQSQTWVRFAEGWKIVAAHVSMVP
ncbi:MAG: hypothetical protein AD742_09615 [Methylibium sp. NZG]|nr:MAG: hypothetical protein AD742_09615 [Methylibium sp. NZG]